MAKVWYLSFVIVQSYRNIILLQQLPRGSSSPPSPCPRHINALCLKSNSNPAVSQTSIQESVLTTACHIWPSAHQRHNFHIQDTPLRATADFPARS